MDYRLLADLVLAVHGLFVAFVVFGGLLALWKRWIAYLHLPALGSPDPARDAAKSGDLKKFERLYRQQLATVAAEAALTRVLEMASAAPVCLMCYEREPSECHRQFTIEPLEARSGQKARHLFAAPPAKQGSLI